MHGLGAMANTINNAMPFHLLSWLTDWFDQTGEMWRDSPVEAVTVR